MNVCTIIARNYLAHARVLADSFFENHPHGTLTVLLLDEKAGLAADRFNAVVPTDVGLDEEEYLRMAAIYDVMELATAVKPWLMRHLLETTAEPILYLDPDIQVFASLEELEVLAREHRLALTPHVAVPSRYDREAVAQNAIRLGGVYNLGFLGVGQNNDGFLDWWEERLRRDCIVAPERGIFVDQRWFDAVPALFEHVVVGDPSVNVAWWNLETRELRRVGDGYTVDERPLTFFHFSGFDPREPHLLSKHQGSSPSILLSEHPEAAELCEAYADRLERHGFSELVRQPYRFEMLDNGIRYDDRMRRLYRSALTEAEQTGEQNPPNPFAEEAEFIRWLAEPPDRTGQARGVSRYLHALRADRADLQQRFYDLRWLDGNDYLEWARTHGMLEEGLPPELVGGGEPAPPPQELAREYGVNLVGYLQAEAGVGEAARLVAAAIRHAQIPMTTLTYRATLSRQEHAAEQDDDGRPRFDTNVICVNADQLPSFTYEAGPDFFADRYSIGVWWWEVAEFPDWLHRAFDIVHEVWVGSEHVARAIGTKTNKPVLVFPLPVAVPEAPALNREALGLSDGFLFLFSFDFLSVFERKNPLGVVSAFTQAFAPDEGPLLVLKSINGDKRLPELERLRAATADRTDIVVLDGYLDAEQKNALMASCDAYVSLHRSEGFGLTLAEAMAYGRPVIATAYSGNLDFMDESNSYLVPSHETPIPTGADPYPAGAVWGDPDVDEAARLMRQVYEHQEEALERGRRARHAMRTDRSLERAADFVRERLEDIHRERQAPPAAANEPVPSIEEIARAERFLSAGPALPIRAPSRFGAPGVFLRRVVYRLLRPYLVRQRELENDVVASLVRLDAQLARAEQASYRRSQELTHVVAAASERFDRTSRTAARTSRTGATLERSTARLQDELGDAMNTLADIARDVEETDHRLHQPIYMATPDALILTDDDGRKSIGYRGGGRGEIYRGFEDVFRGPEDLIKDRQGSYVDVVRGHEPVLDVGCGRGEFLDLLREAGIAAKGVDLDPGMVGHAQAKGHEVELADANAHLATLSDESLGTVFAAQVVEHLDYDDLVRFLRLAHSKLQPDGILMFETVNPYSVAALRAFWVDLTHKLPIYPEVAVVLCRLVGFDEAVVTFPNGSGELERDRREQGEYCVTAVRRDGS